MVTIFFAPLIIIREYIWNLEYLWAFEQYNCEEYDLE